MIGGAAEAPKNAEAAKAAKAAKTAGDVGMDKNIFRFIWRYSKRQQIIVSLLTVASFPFLYAALQLPKVIVNDAIDGTEFPKEIVGFPFDQVPYLLTLCTALFVLLVINALFQMAINTYRACCRNGCCGACATCCTSAFSVSP